MNEFKIVKCKGCGADIFFEQGVPWYAKKVPVLIGVPNISGVDDQIKTSAYVSHFVNCPKANEFSKGKK
jgi:hypothetical protein